MTRVAEGTMYLCQNTLRVYSLEGGKDFSNPKNNLTNYQSQLDMVSSGLKIFIKHFEPNLFNMKYYNWKLETGNAIWMSSDIGSVKASSLDQAKEKAHKIVHDMFKAINNTLNGDDNTDQIHIGYAPSAIEVTETTKDNLQQDINN
jgi:hypothetical protein